MLHLPIGAGTIILKSKAPELVFFFNSQILQAKSCKMRWAICLCPSTQRISTLNHPQSILLDSNWSPLFNPFYLSVFCNPEAIKTEYSARTVPPPGPDIAESHQAWCHAIREILSCSKPFKSTGRHSSP